MGFNKTTADTFSQNMKG